MRITQQKIRSLHPPEKGNKVTYDDEVTGFGVRITAAGAISFVLRYVVDRQERRLTIGKYPDLSASAARDEAISLRGMVSKGVDPLERRHERGRAPTMRELAEYYLSGHATTKRPKSVKDDCAMLDGHILPRLGNRKGAAVSSHDIIRLRNSLEDRPYRANRVLSLLGKMFSIAMKQRWREDNPARDVARFPEEKRDRWREEHGLALRRYWSNVCLNCAIKKRCTTAKERRITVGSTSTFSKRSSVGLMRIRGKCARDAKRSNTPSAPSKPEWVPPTS